FHLLDKSTGTSAAQATVWDMEGFSFCWGLAAMGVVDWFVQPPLRRRGLGKFLLAQLLRQAQEELLEVMEIQVPAGNQIALQLCQGLGFEQVDVGKMYQKVG